MYPTPVLILVYKSVGRKKSTLVRLKKTVLFRNVNIEKLGVTTLDLRLRFLKKTAKLLLARSNQFEGTYSTALGLHPA